MSSLRIRAPAGDDEPLGWVRLAADGGILARGEEGQLAPDEGDETVDLVIPAERATLIQVRVSAEQKARLSDDNLPWLAEPMAMQDVEKLQVARGAFSADGALSMGLVDRGWLGQIIARLAARGIRPDRIVPELLAAPWQPGRWTLVQRPAGGFVRTGPESGFSLDPARGEQMPVTLQLAARTLPLPEQIDCFAEGAESTGEIPRSLAGFPVPVRAAGQWNWWRGNAVTTMDFACGAFQPSGRGSHLLRALKPAVWLLAGIAVINLAGMGVESLINARERNRLKSEIEAVLRQTFPQTTVVLDPLLQMRRGVDRLALDAGVPAAGDFLPLLGRAAEALRGKSFGKIEALQYEPGNLMIETTPPDAAATGTLRDSLAAAGLKAGVETTASGRVKVSVTP